MRIVHAASEAVPFAKTGGLADVASALSKALAQEGHEVSLIVPYYSKLFRGDTAGLVVEPTGLEFDIPIGAKRMRGRLLCTCLPGSSVTVFLVSQPDYFDREGLYQNNGIDYPDNCERFVFFSRAVMEVCRLLSPQIVHVHDWQTGLIPALLDIEFRDTPGFERIASVLTIHNIAFQGRFWHWDMPLTGLDWKHFNWQELEFYGSLNLLKTGIAFADAITTVSPTYAREVQTLEAGCGLDSVLRTRADDLTGILNGVDTEVWNPATDQNLVRTYTPTTAREGKSACKGDLQQRTGLPVRSDVPLFGIISRMTDQKGLDLLVQCSDAFLQEDVQFTFLGTGEPRYEGWLQQLAQGSPHKVSGTIGFDETLAHKIEAAADIYLMPSRFEPCGLNQMYSLMYGTIPIVRTVGGLADSVIDATDDNLANGTANGFQFADYRSEALLGQIHRAVAYYRDKGRWDRLIQNAMHHDWSWKRSAARYLEVYERALANRRPGGKPRAVLE